MNLPYSDEYRPGKLFWDASPASFVRRFAHLLPADSVVLDVGCGEGKNSIWLAKTAQRVVAIDASLQALSNFSLNPGYGAVEGRIERAQMDARALGFPPGVFDVVVAYGLLHCFPDHQLAYSVVHDLLRLSRPGSYHIIAALDRRLPVDLSVHPYLAQEGLVSADQLRSCYSSAAILAYEHDTIEETHPTTRTPHRHSIVRLLARL